MSHMICTKCDEEKPRSSFRKWSHVCKVCRAAHEARKIECTVCGKMITIRGITKHKNKSRCTRLISDNPFHSASRDRVECPCKHPSCIGNVTQATTWRHHRDAEKYWKRMGITHIFYPDGIDPYASISFAGFDDIEPEALLCMESDDDDHTLELKWLKAEIPRF